MLSKYIKARKDFVKLTHLRSLGNSITGLADVVIDITDDPNVKIQLADLRAREQALLDSMEAEIPWICKIKPVK